MLIGRAKVKEQPQRKSSKILTEFGPFGMSLSLVKIKFPSAGNNKTGKGKNTRLRAVYAIPFFAAAFDLPYSLDLSSLYTETPSLSSFYLIRIKLAAPADEPAKIAKKEFAKIKVGPLNTANYFAKILRVKRAIDMETATAPQ